MHARTHTHKRARAHTHTHAHRRLNLKNMSYLCPVKINECVERDLFVLRRTRIALEKIDDANYIHL